MTCQHTWMLLDQVEGTPRDGVPQLTDVVFCPECQSQRYVCWEGETMVLDLHVIVAENHLNRIMNLKITERILPVALHQEYREKGVPVGPCPSMRGEVLND